MKGRSRLYSTLLLVGGCVALLYGCGAASSPASEESNRDGLHVVVTTNILGDVVTQLVADVGTVETLMPVGVDPHDFQLSAREAASLREADLVIANGLGLEEGMTDALKTAQTDGANVIEVAEQVDPLEMGEGHGHEGEEEHDGHTHGEGLDPHFWLDPVRMETAVEVIADELSQLEVGPDESVWEERANNLIGEIETAHQDFAASLDQIPEERRVLITNHDALGYFANRYEFEIVDVVIPGGSSLGEASASDIARLVDVIDAEGVSAVITEATDTSSLGDTLAAETGRNLAVVPLHIGSLDDPGSEAGSYLGMMRSNVAALVAALREGADH